MPTSQNIDRLKHAAKIGVTIGGAFAAMFGQRLWAFGVAVMLVNNTRNPWITTLHRFLEVSFGILVAVAVSAVISPPRSPDRV